MTAAALFEAVKLAYDNEGLKTLTNIRDPNASSIDETYGDATAQSVIDLWPAYTQVAYDSSNALHVEVAIEAVIALMFRRGGHSTTINEVTWREVFGEGGMMEKVKNTSPRSHKSPVSNSGVTFRRENADGKNIRGWSDPDALPPSFLPSNMPAS